MDEDLIERKVSSQRVFDGTLLQVNQDVVTLPNGSKAVREWIRHQGAAAVVPVLENGDIIMVRQYRYPIQQVTLEIPAGKLDHPEEDPLACARRELKEETGYRAEHMVKLATIATTVGFSNERIHLYAAKNLTAGEQCPDEDEFIHMTAVPFKQALAMIADGTIYDAKSVTAILLLQQQLEKNSGFGETDI